MNAAGPPFPTMFLIGRAALVERLKQGKKFVTGQRKPNLGGMFETRDSVALAGDIITTQPGANHDFLDAVPVF